MIKLEFMFKRCEPDNKEINSSDVIKTNFYIGCIAGEFKKKMNYSELIICDGIITEGPCNGKNKHLQVISHEFTLKDTVSFNLITRTIKTSFIKDFKDGIIKDLKKNGFYFHIIISTPLSSAKYSVQFKNLHKEKNEMFVECKPWGEEYINLLIPQYVEITGSDI